MRICHVLETSGGGSGRVVYELARHGLENGDDVTIIYAPDRADPSYVSLLASLADLRLFSCPMQRKIGLRDIIDAWNLYRLIRTEGPFDIIHGHSSKAGALSRIAGIFYSMMPNASRLYGAIEWILSWLTPCIISVSQGEFRHSEQLGILKSKLYLVPNGTTPHFASSRALTRQALGIEDNCTLFGFVGRMEPQKNPLRAIEAFAIAAANFPEARFILVGDGGLKSAAEAECAGLNLKKSVTLLGAYDALRIIPGFDCLIGSSEFETLPISFLECLSAGVPIVTTPIGGVEEVITDGVTGFAARDFTKEALAEAIGQYLGSSPQERTQMSKAALKRSKLYTASIMGDKYRELYKRFLKDKR